MRTLKAEVFLIKTLEICYSSGKHVACTIFSNGFLKFGLLDGIQTVTLYIFIMLFT